MIPDKSKSVAEIEKEHGQGLSLFVLIERGPEAALEELKERRRKESESMK